MSYKDAHKTSKKDVSRVYESYMLASCLKQRQKFWRFAHDDT